jgi:hypothetical protein
LKIDKTNGLFKNICTHFSNCYLLGLGSLTCNLGLEKNLKVLILGVVAVDMMLKKFEDLIINLFHLRTPSLHVAICFK